MLPVVGVPAFNIKLPFTSREPGEVPNELDLRIDELLINFSGLDPLDDEVVFKRNVELENKRKEIERHTIEASQEVHNSIVESRRNH